MMFLFVLAAAATPADRSPEAARQVVERYYAAIDRHDYRAAWLAWDRGGAASGRPFRSFAQGFAGTAHSRVRVGPATDAEGAAGSVFITVPVRVDAVLRSGARQRFSGRYVLRRVNDVAGATAAQLNWHIASASLKPAR